MGFDYDVFHVYLYTADMLSRSPLQNFLDKNTQPQQKEVEYFMQAVTRHLTASQTHLNMYCQGPS